MVNEEQEKTAKKSKRATAQKREMQAQKRRLSNRAFRSEVRTIIKQYRVALEKGDKAELKAILTKVFSLVDKGVNKSIFKRNKANRIKSRLTARFHAIAK